jgi:hypothetical protein
MMMTWKWEDFGLRSVHGCFGIRREGDHWRCFDDNGDFPGEFFNKEAARSGCWMSEAGAREINEGEHRLIVLDDVLASMRHAMAKAEAAQKAA